MKVPRSALLTFAVVAEVLLDLLMFGLGVQGRQPVLLMGGLARAFGMSVLGGLAMSGVRWALWTFVGLDSVTTLAGLFVTFHPLGGGGFRFEPAGLLMFGTYGTIVLTAAVGGKATRPSPG